MARLKDDCFAFGGEVMRIEEGLALLAARIEPIADTESVALSEADGRVLAEDVVASIDLPGFDNSAVDGWAVRHADLAERGETRLAASGRTVAGDGQVALLGSGEARRIFTGARMPEGADTVFMQEDVRVEGNVVIFPEGLAAGANRRLAGEDIAAGTVALPKGRRLRPQEVSLAAALGLLAVPVRRRLAIAVLSTGSELVSAGAPLSPGFIHDSNRPLLIAMLKRLGAAVTDLGQINDAPDALRHRLEKAVAQHDLVLSTGGVSIGEEDHTRRAIEAAGRLVLWRLAIKPGRPVTMGMIAGTPVVGLPGNPVAAFVTFVHVVRPLLAALGGESYAPPIPIPVPVRFSYRKRPGRREYVRVRLVRDDDGQIGLEKFPREGAAALNALTETDGLAELSEPVTRVEPGSLAGFLPYAVLL